MGGKEEITPMHHLGYYHQKQGGDFFNTKSKENLNLGRKYSQLTTAAAQELEGLLSVAYTGILFQCKL